MSSDYKKSYYNHNLLLFYIYARCEKINNGIFFYNTIIFHKYFHLDQIKYHLGLKLK